MDTLAELGWSELANGELLERAEAPGFDAFVPTDQNFRYQQSLAQRTIRIVVLMNTSWQRMQRCIPVIAAALEGSDLAAYVEIPI